LTEAYCLRYLAFLKEQVGIDEPQLLELFRIPGGSRLLRHIVQYFVVARTGLTQFQVLRLHESMRLSLLASQKPEVVERTLARAWPPVIIYTPHEKTLHYININAGFGSGAFAVNFCPSLLVRDLAHAFHNYRLVSLVRSIIKNNYSPDSLVVSYESLARTANAPYCYREANGLVQFVMFPPPDGLRISLGSDSVPFGSLISHPALDSDFSTPYAVPPNVLGFSIGAYSGDRDEGRGVVFTASLPSGLKRNYLSYGLVAAGLEEIEPRSDPFGDFGATLYGPQHITVRPAPSGYSFGETPFVLSFFDELAKKSVDYKGRYLFNRVFSFQTLEKFEKAKDTYTFYERCYFDSIRRFNPYRHEDIRTVWDSQETQTLNIANTDFTTCQNCDRVAVVRYTRPSVNWGDSDDEVEEVYRCKYHRGARGTNCRINGDRGWICETLLLSEEAQFWANFGKANGEVESVVITRHERSFEVAQRLLFDEFGGFGPLLYLHLARQQLKSEIAAPLSSEPEPRPSVRSAEGLVGVETNPGPYNRLHFLPLFEKRQAYVSAVATFNVFEPENLKTVYSTTIQDVEFIAETDLEVCGLCFRPALNIYRPVDPFSELPSFARCYGHVFTAREDGWHEQMVMSEEYEIRTVPITPTWIRWSMACSRDGFIRSAQRVETDVSLEVAYSLLFDRHGGYGPLIQSWKYRKCVKEFFVVASVASNQLLTGIELNPGPGYKPFFSWFPELLKTANLSVNFETQKDVLIRRTFGDGTCYLHLFPRTSWYAVYLILGKNPLASALLECRSYASCDTSTVYWSSAALNHLTTSRTGFLRFTWSDLQGHSGRVGSTISAQMDSIMRSKDIMAEVAARIANDNQSAISAALNRYAAAAADELEAQQNQRTNMPIHTSLTEKDRTRLEAYFPWIKFQIKPGPPSAHGCAGVVRVAEQRTLMSMIPKHAKFIDVGGAVMEHLLTNTTTGHVCSPILDARDGLRRSKEITRLQQAFTGPYTSQAMLDKAAERISWLQTNTCRERSENCRVQAEFAIFVHSTYDMNTANIGQILDVHGVRHAKGTFIFDPLVIVATSGYISALDCEFQVHPAGSRLSKIHGYQRCIEFSFRGDSGSLNYVHDYEQYLHFALTTHIKTPENLYVIERTLRGGTCWFDILRVDAAQSSSVLTYRLWFTPEAPCRKVVAYTHDDGPLRSDFMNSTRHEFWISEAFYDKVMSYATRLTDQNFTPQNVRIYGHGVNVRWTVNGVETSIEQKAPARIVDLVCCAIFVEAFQARAAMHQSVMRQVSLILQRRGIRNSGLAAIGFKTAWKITTDHFRDDPKSIIRDADGKLVAVKCLEEHKWWEYLFPFPRWGRALRIWAYDNALPKGYEIMHTAEADRFITYAEAVQAVTDRGFSKTDYLPLITEEARLATAKFHRSVVGSIRATLQSASVVSKSESEQALIQRLDGLIGTVDKWQSTIPDAKVVDTVLPERRVVSNTLKALGDDADMVTDRLDDGGQLLLENPVLVSPKKISNVALVVLNAVDPFKVSSTKVSLMASIGSYFKNLSDKDSFGVVALTSSAIEAKMAVLNQFRAVCADQEVWFGDSVQPGSLFSASKEAGHAHRISPLRRGRFSRKAPEVGWLPTSAAGQPGLDGLSQWGSWRNYIRGTNAYNRRVKKIVKRDAALSTKVQTRRDYEAYRRKHLYLKPNEQDIIRAVADAGEDDDAKLAAFAEGFNVVNKTGEMLTKFLGLSLDNYALDAREAVLPARSHYNTMAREAMPGDKARFYRLNRGCFTDFNYSKAHRLQVYNASFGTGFLIDEGNGYPVEYIPGYAGVPGTFERMPFFPDQPYNLYVPFENVPTVWYPALANAEDELNCFLNWNYELSTWLPSFPETPVFRLFEGTLITLSLERGSVYQKPFFLNYCNCQEVWECSVCNSKLSENVPTSSVQPLPGSFQDLDLEAFESDPEVSYRDRSPVESAEEPRFDFFEKEKWKADSRSVTPAPPIQEPEKPRVINLQAPKPTKANVKLGFLDFYERLENGVFECEGNLVQSMGEEQFYVRPLEQPEATGSGLVRSPSARLKLEIAPEPTPALEAAVHHRSVASLASTALELEPGPGILPSSTATTPKPITLPVPEPSPVPTLLTEEADLGHDDTALGPEMTSRPGIIPLHPSLRKAAMSGLDDYFQANAAEANIELINTYFDCDIARCKITSGLEPFRVDSAFSDLARRIQRCGQRCYAHLEGVERITLRTLIENVTMKRDVAGVERLNCSGGFPIVRFKPNLDRPELECALTGDSPQAESIRNWTEYVKMTNEACLDAFRARMKFKSMNSAKRLLKAQKLGEFVPVKRAPGGDDEKYLIPEPMPVVCVYDPILDKVLNVKSLAKKDAPPPTRPYNVRVPGAVSPELWYCHKYAGHTGFLLEESFPELLVTPIPNPELTTVLGVPGCGKTYRIGAHALWGDLALSATRMAAEELHTNFGDDSPFRNFMTADSAIINHHEGFPAVDTLWQDEFAALHPGQLQALIVLYKPGLVRAYGDPQQCRWQNRLNDARFKPVAQEYHEDSVEEMNETWRLGIDATQLARKYYPKIVTRSKIKKTIFLMPYSAAPKFDKAPDLIMSYKQQHKSELRRLIARKAILGNRTQTINEAQGSSVEYAVIWRPGDKGEDEVYSSSSHTIVGLTRHTHRLEIYSDVTQKKDSIYLEAQRLHLVKDLIVSADYSPLPETDFQ